jgi:hypothetical protein
VQSERTPPPEQQPDPDVALEALALLLEVHLEVLGPEGAVAYLRRLAADLEDAEDAAVSLKDGAAGNRAKRLARAWVRRKLTIWLAKLV